MGFVLFGPGPAVKGSQVATFSRLRIFLARIKPVLAGREFSDHADALRSLRFGPEYLTSIGRFSLHAQFAKQSHQIGQLIIGVETARIR